MTAHCVMLRLSVCLSVTEKVWQNEMVPVSAVADTSKKPDVQPAAPPPQSKAKLHRFIFSSSLLHQELVPYCYSSCYCSSYGSTLPKSL